MRTEGKEDRKRDAEGFSERRRGGGGREEHRIDRKRKRAEWNRGVKNG
jgi:hypothetical protein